MIIKKKKVYLLKKYILSKNKNCKIFCYDLKLNSYNLIRFLLKFSVIVDGTDNIYSRKIINILSIKTYSPYVYAALDNFEIFLGVFNFNNSSCFECFEKKNSESITFLNCNAFGVINVIPSLLSLLQCLEVFKIIINHKNILVNKVLVFDFLFLNLNFIFLKKINTCICNNKNLFYNYFTKKKIFCLDKNEFKYLYFLDDLFYINNVYKNINIILEDNFFNFSSFSFLLFNLNDVYNNKQNKIMKIFYMSKKNILIFYCNFGRKSYDICNFLKYNKIFSNFLIGGIRNLVKYF